MLLMIYFQVDHAITARLTELRPHIFVMRFITTASILGRRRLIDTAPLAIIPCSIATTSVKIVLGVLVARVSTLSLLVGLGWRATLSSDGVRVLVVVVHHDDTVLGLGVEPGPSLLDERFEFEAVGATRVHFDGFVGVEIVLLLLAISVYIVATSFAFPSRSGLLLHDLHLILTTVFIASLSIGRIKVVRISTRFKVTSAISGEVLLLANMLRCVMDEVDKISLAPQLTILAPRQRCRLVPTALISLFTALIVDF